LSQDPPSFLHHEVVLAKNKLYEQNYKAVAVTFELCKVSISSKRMSSSKITTDSHHNFTRGKPLYHYTGRVVFRVLGNIKSPKGVIVIEDSDKPQVMALAQYIWLTEQLTELTVSIGEIGKALQGEGDLREKIGNVAKTCENWLKMIE
jgi:hypothetical protein